MQPRYLGPFQIVRVIGRGGMGAVYEGFHVDTFEKAALKVLINPVEEDEELHLRFEVEIETLKKLRHPNIVRLYGFGEEQFVRYYVMELVDGLSLQQELRRKRPFRWEEVCKIGWDLSRALKHAHDRGIIHRDIKPANILLERKGGVKLSDFGIAHIFGGNRLTHVHSVVGTLEYMSPEQSQAAPIGPKSDLFALGAVLYTLLVGHPPFQARSLSELLKKHKEETPRAITEVRKDVPEMLESLIFELLNIKPDQRPINAYILGRRFQVILRAFLGNPDLVQIQPSSSGEGSISSSSLDAAISSGNDGKSEDNGGRTEKKESEDSPGGNAQKSVIPSPKFSESESAMSSGGVAGAYSGDTYTFGGNRVPSPKSDFDVENEGESFHFPPEPSFHPRENESVGEKRSDFFGGFQGTAEYSDPIDMEKKGKESGSRLSVGSQDSSLRSKAESLEEAGKEERSENRAASSFEFSPNDKKKPPFLGRNRNTMGVEDFALGSNYWGGSSLFRKRTQSSPGFFFEDSSPQTRLDSSTSALSSSRMNPDFANDPVRSGAVVGGKPVPSDVVRSKRREKNAAPASPEPLEADSKKNMEKEHREKERSQDYSEKSRLDTSDFFQDSQNGNSGSRPITHPENHLQRKYIDWREISAYALKKRPNQRELIRLAHLPPPQEEEHEKKDSAPKSPRTLKEGERKKEARVPPQSVPRVSDAIKNDPLGSHDLFHDSTLKSTHASHFVAVKEEELGDFVGEKVNPPRPLISMQTVFASISLLLIGFFTWFAVQPVPPDVLYERIMKSIGEDNRKENGYDISRLRSAEKQISDFITLYPNDPRTAKMNRYIEEIKLYRLQREFEQRVNRLSDMRDLQPLERATLEAYALSRSQPEKAVKKFQAIVDLYSSDPTIFLDDFEEEGANPENENPENTKPGENSRAVDSLEEPEIESDRSLEKSGVNKGNREKAGRPRSESRNDLCVEFARRQLQAIRPHVESIIKEQETFLRKRLHYAEQQELYFPERADEVRRSIIELYRDKTWAQPYVEQARASLLETP